MSIKSERTRSKIPKKIFMEPRYRGKHIIMVAGKIFAAKTSEEASKIFDKVTQKYKGQSPTITYIPKEDTLILILYEKN